MSLQVFYQLLSAPPATLPDAVRAALPLGRPEACRYLAQSRCFGVKGRDDGSDFLVTARGVNDLFPRASERARVWSTLAAVLLLGNVRFADAADDGSSVIDCEDEEMATTVAALLGLSGGAPELERAMCERRLTVRGQVRAFTACIHSVAMSDREASPGVA